LVQAADLRRTVALDILALNLEPADEPYSHLLTIDDEAALIEIVDALDRPMGPGPQLACIPLYWLNFRLADGRTVEFEYSCGEGQGTFLRGGAPPTLAPLGNHPTGRISRSSRHSAERRLAP
jgi:hypothetical protein